MSWIRLDLVEGRTAFRPGEEVRGVVSWSFDGADAPPASVEVHLLWYTRGKGTQDSEVVATESPGDVAALGGLSGALDFRLRLPASPYSVSGKLVSIVWAVEAVIDPGARAERVEITVSPTGREVLLHPDLPADEGPETE